MSKKENIIQIDVKGPTGSGKSVIAYLLADFLSYSELTTELTMLDETKAERIEETFSRRLQSLKDRGTRIIINEVQTKRDSLVE